MQGHTCPKSFVRKPSGAVKITAKLGGPLVPTSHPKLSSRNTHRGSAKLPRHHTRHTCDNHTALKSSRRTAPGNPPFCVLNSDEINAAGNAQPGLPRGQIALNTQELISKTLPLVTERSVVSAGVKFSSALVILDGRDDYLEDMTHWASALPQRLPGLEVKLQNILQPEPGIIVVRWKAHWRMQLLRKLLRKQHANLHQSAGGSRNNQIEGPITAEASAEEKDTVRYYCVYGSSRLLLDDDGCLCQHLDTFDFEPEGEPQERAWALFDYCMALRPQRCSTALWTFRVLKLFILESLKDGAIGDEIGVMSEEEREDFSTQLILFNIALAASLAGFAAYIIICADLLIKSFF
ncbi:hypothetical protein CYMTET_50578 [Cymbomonas tetramitiformis]|uniref:Uncharacterized protein n=1 Tax=Cymbomonas tetramitiformis TaxID=36881 RepID=A0AAE0BNX6_9CHLO|nr:hypothetical protein CYMTET_50578 [Cymbomonas tetramitiformis]